jgi:hypothetical protein
MLGVRFRADVPGFPGSPFGYFDFGSAQLGTLTNQKVAGMIIAGGAGVYHAAGSAIS